MATYNHIYQVVRVSPFGYYHEAVALPDWINIEIKEDNATKYVYVHSRIHKNPVVKLPTSYSTEFTDIEILKDCAGTIAHRWGV